MQEIDIGGLARDGEEYKAIKKRLLAFAHELDRILTVFKKRFTLKI